MGSIHADLSAQHKALPDVFTSKTCVSDKWRLTSGETSSKQRLQSRLDVIIRALFSQMFCINFQIDHRKNRVWSFFIYTHASDTKDRGIKKCDLMKGSCTPGVHSTCTVAFRGDFTGYSPNQRQAYCSCFPSHFLQSPSCYTCTRTYASKRTHT